MSASTRHGNSVQWIVLAVAVTMMSSAGTAFAIMNEVPPILRASWRLWSTSFLQLVPFVLQFKTLSLAQRHRWFKTIPIMMLCGGSLALHFGAWVWSIDHTSLTHSLLLVSSHPLIFVALLWLSVPASCALKRWKPGLVHRRPRASSDSSILPPAPQDPHSRVRTRVQEFVSAALAFQHPSLLETVGAIVGFGGAALMVMDSDAGHDTSLSGDLAAFIGAAAMVVYIAIGRRCRSWMPLFVYALPVTVTAAIAASLASLLMESNSDVMASGLSTSSWFGWLGNGTRFLITFVWLGLGAGIGGHTAMNSVLRHIPSLVVSVSLLAEPLVGSLIGAAADKQDMPTIWTWLGGVVLMCGAAAVVFGSNRREEVSAQTVSSDGTALCDRAVAEANGDSVVHSESDGQFHGVQLTDVEVNAV